jgi:hypothetical protein
VEVKSKRAGRPKGTPQIDRAVDILKERLSAGPCSYRNIRAATKDIGWRTVEKAAKKLRVISQREQGFHFWRLPGVAITDGLSVPAKESVNEADEPEEVDGVMAEFAAADRAEEEAKKEEMQKLAARIKASDPNQLTKIIGRLKKGELSEEGKQLLEIAQSEFSAKIAALLAEPFPEEQQQ